MPRTCTICRHVQCQDIDKALVAGEPFRNIGKRFETSWQAIRRHKDHLSTQVAKAHNAQEVAKADDLLASITGLRERLQTALDDAQVARDVAILGRELRETFRMMLELEGRLRHGAQVNVGVAMGTQEPKHVKIVVQHVRLGADGREEILSETERDVPPEPGSAQTLLPRPDSGNGSGPGGRSG